LSANTGRVIAIPGDYPELTAEFSGESPGDLTMIFVFTLHVKYSAVCHEN
jgi:hypothetical protein